MQHLIHGLGREALDVLAVTLLEMGEKVCCQQGNVICALTQRGDLNGDDVEAEIKVFPEIVVGHFFSEIPVGGRDDTHIHVLAAV